jgi:chemotaxis protein MotA
MNLAFIIGFIGAFAVTAWGIIDSGELMAFYDFPSIVITIGGTFMAIIACFPFKDLAKIPKHFPIILGIGKHKWDPIYYINTMTELSTEARRKGLLALEDRVAEFEDPFLRDSVMLIVDAMEPDKVRDQLDNELSNIEARHSVAWNIYDKGAALGPGFGMIGTLIGLINMLDQMNFEEEGGAQQLAASMAIALITTFYGSMLANVVFMPMSNQLRMRHEEEMLCKEIVIEGIISIQAGENPRHINEKLMAYLDRRQRDKLVAQRESATE